MKPEHERLKAALAHERMVYEDLLADSEDPYPGEDVDLDDQRQTVLDLALQVVDTEPKRGYDDARLDIRDAIRSVKLAELSKPLGTSAYDAPYRNGLIEGLNLALDAADVQEDDDAPV